MAQIILTLDDNILSRVLLEAIEQESTLEDYLSDAIAQVLEIPVEKKAVVDIERIIETALHIAATKQVGDEFLLSDVCGVDDWASMGGGERKQLGKGFRKAVENRASHIAVFMKRTTGNKAVYKRI